MMMVMMMMIMVITGSWSPAAMWLDELPVNDKVISMAVVDLANCSSSRADEAAAKSASQAEDHSQIASVELFKQVMAIICWVLGLPG